MNTGKDKILRKAKKLLAMSRDVKSENEALIAASRLHKLLTVHNISLESLEDSENDIGRESFNGTNWPWKRRIHKAISSLYFCESYTYFTKKNYADYFTVGTETNRYIAREILISVFTLVEAQAKVHSMGKRGKLDSTYITAFRNGAADRIVQRCMKLRRESIQQDQSEKLKNSQSGLPSLLDTYALHTQRNTAWLDERVTLSKIKSKARAKDDEAEKDGVEVGEKVKLFREIEKTDKLKLPIL